ncbi:UNVERIFIED_CONTAM: hypothetical protein FKN15_057621 [Acipenser sinensis]
MGGDIVESGIRTAAWQKLAPVARTSTTRFARNAAPVRHMSSSSAPGSTGDNLMYIILCGGSFAGAGYYVYKTLTTDSARFQDRVTEIISRPKSEWTPKPWPSNKSEDSGEAEAAEEAAPEPLVEAAEALEEALAEASTESPSPAESTEAGVADAPAAEEEISSLVEESQEPAPTDAAPVQESEDFGEAEAAEEAAPEPLEEAAEALEEALAEASTESPSPAESTEAGVADAPAAEEEISSLVEESQEPAPTDAAPVQG